MIRRAVPAVRDPRATAGRLKSTWCGPKGATTEARGPSSGRDPAAECPRGDRPPTLDPAVRPGTSPARRPLEAGAPPGDARPLGVQPPALAVPGRPPRFEPAAAPR